MTVEPSQGNRARRFTLESLVESIQQLELISVVSLLTLFLAVIFPFEHWVFAITARVCLFLFLVFPIIIRKPAFWAALALSATVVTILEWETTDNHKYLLLYWLWVMVFCHAAVDPNEKRRVLIFNARFFLCFVFLAAVAQKLLSPSYRSGEMFEFFLYCDPRFTAFGKLVGIDPAVADAVQKILDFFKSPFSQVINNDLLLPGTDRARIVALVLTFWDLSLQSLIGLLFLLRRTFTDKIAHILLLFFVFTTYLPAPVYGFGWILAIMGFTLAKDKFPRIAGAYFASFFAILLYQLPWREWVLGIKG